MKIPRKTERGHKARIAASLAASAVVIASALVVALLVSRSPPEEEGLAAPNPVPEEAPIPPLSGPPTIAIQAGHWQASELPDELAKLRSSTGASYGKLREVDINRAVSDSLAKMVEAEGWRPLLLPATVPPGLRADAFIAIHADWSDSPAKRGWKVAPPWRASRASRLPRPVHIGELRVG